MLLRSFHLCGDLLLTSSHHLLDGETGWEQIRGGVATDWYKHITFAKKKINNYRLCFLLAETMYQKTLKILSRVS